MSQGELHPQKNKPSFGLIFRYHSLHHHLRSKQRKIVASLALSRSSTAAMMLWRKSIDKMRRKTRFGRQISWSLVPAEDPDEALASLRDQGLYIEEISIPLRAQHSAADDCSKPLCWPRRAQSISRSLPGPPIRFVVISDTHSRHESMNRVRPPSLCCLTPPFFALLCFVPFFALFCFICSSSAVHIDICFRLIRHIQLTLLLAATARGRRSNSLRGHDRHGESS